MGMRWGNEEWLLNGYRDSFFWSGKNVLNLVVSIAVVVVQSLSYVQLFVTPWTAACQALLSFTISQSLLKHTSIKLMMPSNHLILCHLLLLLFSIFSKIRVYSNESALCIRWPKCWSFSFSISPSDECLELISFRIDCFDLVALQGTLKSLLQAPQFESIDSSVLSLLYGPALTSICDYGKTIALTIQTFVSKKMSHLSNTLSRFVIAFLPRSKCLLISWLQSLSSQILEPKKIKYATVSIVSPSICHEVMGLDAMIFVFWMVNFKPAF